MEIHLTSRHFRCPGILQEYVLRKVSKLEKIYEGIVSCDVILTNEKTAGNSKKVEIKIRVYRSTLAGVVRADDFSKAVNAAIEKLERQLVKYKSKLRERYKLRKRRTALAA
jgi:putative sigma-54 modulation protein